METIVLGEEKTTKLYDDSVFYGYDFSHGDDNFKYITTTEGFVELDLFFEEIIYQRKSDKKYFKLTLVFIEEGHKHMSFESYLNDGEMEEVEKIIKVVTVWQKPSKNTEGECEND